MSAGSRSAPGCSSTASSRGPNRCRLLAAATPKAPSATTSAASRRSSAATTKPTPTSLGPPRSTTAHRQSSSPRAPTSGGGECSPNAALPATPKGPRPPHERTHPRRGERLRERRTSRHRSTPAPHLRAHVGPSGFPTTRADTRQQPITDASSRPSSSNPRRGHLWWRRSWLSRAAWRV